VGFSQIAFDLIAPAFPSGQFLPQSGSKEKACLTAGLIDVLRCPV
jgi:hypothetical protein